METWRQNQVAVTAASFVGFTGFTMVMPFLASYMQDLGVTDVGDVALWTGLTLGVTPAVSAMCAPLWGRVGDRFGNKLLLQRSLASSVVVMGLMAHATQPWHLFALRAVQGLVAGYGPLTDLDGGHVSARRAHGARDWDRADRAAHRTSRSGPCSVDCWPRRWGCETRFWCRRPSTPARS